MLKIIDMLNIVDVAATESVILFEHVRFATVCKSNVLKNERVAYYPRLSAQSMFCTK